MTGNYYPAQMNGPVLTSFGEAVNEEFSKAEAIQNYLYNVSIDNADETELESIGRLIGYVRPLVPNNFDSENLLILGTLPLVQDILTGLSSVEGMSGGQLTSIPAMSGATSDNYMALPTYRKFLKRMAYIKRYGITLYCIDAIASLFNASYEISWNSDNDIVLTYEENIGYKNMWILTQLFYRVCTEPQVLIYSGGRSI